MTQTKRPPISSLSLFGMTLNAWIESGANKSFTFDHVYKMLDQGTLFGDLKAGVPDMDVSAWIGSDYSDERGVEVLGALRDAENGMRGRESRKYGIERGGLSLLLTYVLEAMQQGYFVPKSD